MKIKRILSLLLAAMLIMGAVPVSSFAGATEAENMVGEYSPLQSDASAEEGSCPEEVQSPLKEEEIVLSEEENGSPDTEETEVGEVTPAEAEYSEGSDETAENPETTTLEDTVGEEIEEQQYPWSALGDKALYDWIMDPATAEYISALLKKGGSEWKLLLARIDSIGDSETRKSVLAYIDSVLVSAETEAEPVPEDVPAEEEIPEIEEIASIAEDQTGEEKIQTEEEMLPETDPEEADGTETVTAQETFEELPDTRTDAEEEPAVEEAGEDPETVSEEPEGVFPGPPEGFTLSEKQQQKKASLKASGLRANIFGFKEGSDYEKDTLIFSCTDKAYAQAVADIYGAELKSCVYGVATIVLTKGTVAKAVALACDTDNLYPPVEPNFITPLKKDPPKLMTGSAGTKTTASVSQNWENWVNAEDAILSEPDTYLLDPSSYSYQWQHDMMNTYEAWGVTTGKASVLVAVIDSGVKTSHADLHDISTVDIGCGSDPYERSDHGSHVAGIIAASLGNGIGGAGIAPGVSILSIRVVSNSGGISNSALVQGINAAIEKGADIINISIGGRDHASILEDALKDAYDKGVTVIAAAGNYGDNSMVYPAAYDTVIAVSNVDRTGNRATTSSYGSWVDLSAPGQDIMSTTRNGYGILSGTSMAAPMVTGAAALYMSRMGHVSPAKMRSVLTSAVNDTGLSGMSSGIIDASKLFSGNMTAPAFEIDDKKVSGSVSAKINRKLWFTGRDTGDAVIYTLDGSEPMIVNGKAFRGSVCEEGWLDLSDLGAPGDTVNIKAAFVNSIGVMSDPAAIEITLTVSDELKELHIIAPKELDAGKSVTLAVQVKPESASNKVTWSIAARDGAVGTTLSSDGVLKSAKTDAGTVTVRAVSKANPAISDETVIEIRKVDPVTAINLAKSATLVFRTGFTDKKQLTVQFKTKSGMILGQATESTPDGISAAWRSSNTNVVTVDAYGNITAVGAGSAKVTCRAMDGSGKEKSCSVKVQRGVDSIAVTGQNTVASGTAATYKVTFTPAKPANKTVKWSLENAPAGVTISSKGKLSVRAGLQKTEFTVCAEAQDGSGATDRMTVTIVPRVTSLKLTEPAAGEGAGYSLSKGVLKALLLYSVDIPTSEETENKVSLKYACDGPGESLVWTSSNPAVASVDAGGTVTAIKSGTTTVTVRANDGSGKKASVKVTVTVPASSLTIVPARRGPGDVCYIGVGGNVSNKLVTGAAFGTPANSKVKWNIDAVLADNRDVTEQWRSGKWATVSSSGVLKINKKASNTVENSNNVYVILSATRTADDVATDYVYKIVPKVTLLEPEYYAATLRRQAGDGKVPYVTIPIFSNVYDEDCFVVSSSDPSIAGASMVSGCRLQIYSSTKTGTAYITVMAIDGSGKSVQIKVTVYDE